MLACVLAGCAWNERETGSREFEPIHFLNTDTLYYQVAKSTNVSTCALWSGCEVISTESSVSRSCFSVRAKKNVSCPESLPRPGFPSVPDSIHFEGVETRVNDSIVSDNRVLGFAYLIFLDYVPEARLRGGLFFSKPGDTAWTQLTFPDSCVHVSTLGPEARFYRFQNRCLPQGGWSEDSIQFLGTDPAHLEVGEPVPAASLPDFVLHGVIAADSSKYARLLPDKDGRFKSGIGIYSAEGAEIASITAR